jgi:hypothetical protein
MTGTNVQQIAQQLLHYAHDGNWRLIVAMALMGTVWILRNVLMGTTVQGWKYVGAIAAWLRTDRGGVVLTLLLGVFGGLITALGASAKLTLDLIVTGIVNGLLASGFFVGVKKLFGLSGGTPSQPTTPTSSTPAAVAPMPIPSGSAAAAMSAMLCMFVVAALLSGCASAQKDTMLAELSLSSAVSLGYRTIDGIDKLKTDAIRAEISGAGVGKAQADYDVYKPKIEKARAGINTAEDVLENADRLRQAAQKGAGNWTDYTAYLPTLASMLPTVQQLIADVKGLSQ